MPGSIIHNEKLLTFAQVAHHVIVNASATRAFSEQSDTVRIATKSSDIFVNPSDGHCLVL